MVTPLWAAGNKEKARIAVFCLIFNLQQLLCRFKLFRVCSPSSLQELELSLVSLTLKKQLVNMGIGL
jgi:hypothetical protein